MQARHLCPKVLVLCAMAFFLGACGSAQRAQTPGDAHSLFHDEAFAEVAIPDAKALFALPGDAVNELRSSYQRSKVSRGSSLSPHQWLAKYINASDGGFRYKDNFTRIAGDTFNDREGNCMSLVVLTTAMAEALDIGVEIQDIEVEPVWDKQGDFYLVNDHVNLRLIPRDDSTTAYVARQPMLVDFLPERAVRGYRVNKISKSQLIARFYNNLAAEALVQRDYDRAYALVKAAIVHQADFPSALNTLAVLYRNRGLDAQAEQAYRYALAKAPKDMTSLYNFALLLGEQNRLDEWAQVHKVLELERIHNPYYYYDMAQHAFEEHQYQDALNWYKRAVEKADYRHEFYFGLSKTYWVTGDEKRAKANMQKALALSTDADNKRRYQAKLDAMQH